MKNHNETQSNIQALQKSLAAFHGQFEDSRVEQADIAELKRRIWNYSSCVGGWLREMATVALTRVTKSVTLRVECEYWTSERLVDELYICLIRISDYQKQAHDLIYRIPVYKPTPYFEIKISDLSEQIKKELDAIWNYKSQLGWKLQCLQKTNTTTVCTSK